MQNRIQELLNEQGYRPATFAKKVGIPQSTFAEILSGKRDFNNVGVSKIIAIAEGFGVSVEYLSGQTNTKNESISELPDQGLFLPPDEQTTQSAAEDMLLSLFRQLNTDGQGKLIGLADDFVQSGKYEKKEMSDHCVSDIKTAAIA